MTYLQSEEVPAGIHEHRAEDRPRRTRDGPIPKLVERIGRTQDHARTQLAEICSNIDWPRRFGRCKTVYQALRKLENGFFLAALLGQRAIVQRAPGRFTSWSQISWGVAVGLRREGQKRAPSPACVPEARSKCLRGGRPEACAKGRKAQRVR